MSACPTCLSSNGQIASETSSAHKLLILPSHPLHTLTWPAVRRWESIRGFSFTLQLVLFQLWHDGVQRFSCESNTLSTPSTWRATWNVFEHVVLPVSLMFAAGLHMVFQVHFIPCCMNTYILVNPAICLVYVHYMINVHEVYFQVYFPLACASLVVDPVSERFLCVDAHIGVKLRFCKQHWAGLKVHMTR